MKRLIEAVQALPVYRGRLTRAGYAHSPRWCLFCKRSHPGEHAKPRHADDCPWPEVEAALAEAEQQQPTFRGPMRSPPPDWDF
jgi:hypothetical protein